MSSGSDGQNSRPPEKPHDQTTPLVLTDKRRHESTDVFSTVDENGDPIDTSHTSKRNRVGSATAPPARPDRPRKFGVYLEALDKRRLNDSTVGKKLHDNKIPFHDIFVKGYSQVLVRFNTPAEANFLVHHPTLLDALRCKASLSISQTTARGIIGGVDVAITDEELLAELNRVRPGEVKQVIRVLKNDETKSDNTKIPTPAVILIFTNTCLPNDVRFFSVTRKVNVSVNKPRVCHKCQGFGHMARECKYRLFICGHCAQNHDTRQCPQDRQKESPFCVNCEGAHSPHSLACPVLRQKYSEKLERTLKNTVFQPKPQLNSRYDFPDLPPTAAGLPSQVQSDLQQLQEPAPLPPRAQRRRVRHFNEVLAAQNRTVDQELEHRRKQYQRPPPTPAAQRKEFIRPARTQPKRMSAPPPARNANTSPVPSPQVDLDELSENQVDSLLRQMLSSKRALKLLITVFSVIINMSLNSPDGQEPDLQSVQQEILTRFTAASLGQSQQPHMTHSTTDDMDLQDHDDTY